jgi:hypothetical protein
VGTGVGAPVRGTKRFHHFAVGSDWAENLISEIDSAQRRLSMNGYGITAIDQHKKIG